MERIIPRIQQAAAQAICQLWQLNLPATELVVQHTAKEHSGDFTLVLFPLMKHKLGALPEIGAQLGAALQAQLPDIEGFELVKGFLNLQLSDAFWAGCLQRMAAAPQHGLQLAQQPEKLVVEHSSPNTNKPLHLGHMRTTFLGDAVARICKAAGYTTHVVCLFNDKGIHVCKSMLAWQRFANGATPQSSGIKGDHFVGKWYVAFDKAYREEVKTLMESQGLDEETAKAQAPLMQAAQDMYRRWEAGDPEVMALWQTMNSWVYSGFEQTYARIGVAFDKYYYESETWKLGKAVVEDGLAKGVFTRQEDGSVWIDLTDVNLDRKLVLRRDGTSVYITQDLGTADLRYQDYGMNRSVYVIGNEQDYHMQVLKEILKRLGRSYADGMYHLSYGMIDLPSGKMKSREGTVVDADDLLEEMYQTAKQATEELGKTEGMADHALHTLYETLALGALKYYILKVDPARRMLFNPQESIDFKGHTGTFIQYTHARIHGILRKGAESHPGAVSAPFEAPASLLPEEKALLKRLADWPEALMAAAQGYNPALVANFCYELSKDYSRFHYEVPVLKAETPALLSFRLRLNAQVARTLHFGMGLLGIAMPDRM